MASERDRDWALLVAWRGGDREAGAALFERHYASVARFFHNKAPAAAEDLVQQTFMAAVEARERFRGAASVRTFLFAIAHNQLRTHYSTRGRGRERGDGAGASGDLDFDQVAATDLGPGPSTLIVQREEQRLLLEALRQVPLTYQIVLELHYWEAQSVADIADITGVAVGTAKTRLRRGRQLLEERLAELAASPEALASTLQNLDGWAHDLRAQLGRTG